MSRAVNYSSLIGSCYFDVQGCTHRAIIPFAGAFDMYQNFPVKQLPKLLTMAFDQDLTCFIFSLRWARFPIKNSCNTQWAHLFSMDFDDFSTIYLKGWEHLAHAILANFDVKIQMKRLSTKI